MSNFLKYILGSLLVILFIATLAYVFVYSGFLSKGKEEKVVIVNDTTKDGKKLPEVVTKKYEEIKNQVFTSSSDSINILPITNTEERNQSFVGDFNKFFESSQDSVNLENWQKNHLENLTNVNLFWTITNTCYNLVSLLNSKIYSENYLGAKTFFNQFGQENTHFAMFLWVEDLMSKTKYKTNVVNAIHLFVIGNLLDSFKGELSESQKSVLVKKAAALLSEKLVDDPRYVRSMGNYVYDIILPIYKKQLSLFDKNLVNDVDATILYKKLINSSSYKEKNPFLKENYEFSKFWILSAALVFEINDNNNFKSDNFVFLKKEMTALLANKDMNEKTREMIINYNRSMNNDVGEWDAARKRLAKIVNSDKELKSAFEKYGFKIE